MMATTQCNRGRRSTAPATLRDCQTGCAASDFGTDASDGPQPSRRSLRSIKVTPSEQGFEDDAGLFEIVGCTFEPVDDADDFDDRAVEATHLLGCLHDRGAGRRHILEQDNSRAPFK